VVTLAPLTGLVKFDLAWLLGMTVVALLMLVRQGGVGRRSGFVLIALYMGFVAVQAAFG
jgi:Ca2+/Na+ antiporter